jgi:predicted nucleic acid-binding protein
MNQTSKRIFLDTNIILDFLDDKRPKHPQAMILLDRLSRDGWRIVISEDMFSTIFYIRRGNRQVLEFFRYVLQEWSVVPYGEALMHEAVETSLLYDLDLEDTLQCLCAKKEGCAIVVTEDRGFVDCGVKVMDYGAALRELEARQERGQKAGRQAT